VSTHYLYSLSGFLLFFARAPFEPVKHQPAWGGQVARNAKALGTCFQLRHTWLYLPYHSNDFEPRRQVTRPNWTAPGWHPILTRSASEDRSCGHFVQPGDVHLSCGSITHIRGLPCITLASATGGEEHWRQCHAPAVLPANASAASVRRTPLVRETCEAIHARE
jgi:hypothetical protein